MTTEQLQIYTADIKKKVSEIRAEEQLCFLDKKVLLAGLVKTYKAEKKTNHILIKREEETAPIGVCFLGGNYAKECYITSIGLHSEKNIELHITDSETEEELAGFYPITDFSRDVYDTLIDIITDRLYHDNDE